MSVEGRVREEWGVERERGLNGEWECWLKGE